MAQNYEHIKRWRKKTVDRLREAFNTCCGICGYDKCMSALEFHHLDPTTKDFVIASWRYVAKWSSLVKEVKKCVLLCANCHREVHAGLKEIPVNITRFNPIFEEYRKEKHITLTPCGVCGKQKSEFKTFCSVQCRIQARVVGKWELVDLEKALMQDKLSYQKIAAIVGVSDVAVKKRAKKFGYVSCWAHNSKNDK